MTDNIHKFSEHRKLLLLSAAVGVGSGLSAVLLVTLLKTVKNGIFRLFPPESPPWAYLALPGIGMLLTLLFVRHVVRDDISHGVTRVLVAVSKNKSEIKRHNIWSSIVASSMTIGFGGSVGAEAPIVYTGAAIGSNFGRLCGMSYRNITILLGCGAAGAVAAIFKAPLAGVLFTMEILLFNISMSSMLPLLISTVSATVVAYAFLGNSLPFQCSITEFDFRNIPFYLILGIIGAACSLYFQKATLWLEDKLALIRNHFTKWAICAIVLGILVFLFTPLFGEGYDFLGSLLQGKEFNVAEMTAFTFLGDGRWSIVIFLVMVLLFKVVAMTMTNAGGGVGGTFGPTLFVGGITGFAVAKIINICIAGSGFAVPEQNFALVGMAALMAGVMQAPMTAIFLIAEITGGYELFLPLIITSTVSFGLTRIFERYSIYTKRIAHTGELLTHDNDQAVLALMDIRELVRDKYPRLNGSMTLKQIIPIISESTAQVFPVLGEDGTLEGVVEMDRIRKDLFDTKAYGSTRVYDLMNSPLALIRDDETMESVMNKFDATGAWRLPVLTKGNIYLGFVSRSRILSAYRSELKAISPHDDE